MAQADSLFDEQGNLLPQTDQKPAADAALEARMTLLVQAIAKDQPELALPAFFPVDAYRQVKAIEKPERDWEVRLVRAFRRNIHEYHRKLGGEAATARFLRLEVPEVAVKWMKPGSEGNRLGYFRVLRSRLIVATDERAEVPLEVTSLISWRGHWFVVHLHGFQ